MKGGAAQGDTGQLKDINPRADPKGEKLRKIIEWTVGKHCNE